MNLRAQVRLLLALTLFSLPVFAKNLAPYAIGQGVVQVWSDALRMQADKDYAKGLAIQSRCIELHQEVKSMAQTEKAMKELFKGISEQLNTININSLVKDLSAGQAATARLAYRDLSKHSKKFASMKECKMEKYFDKHCNEILDALFSLIPSAIV